MAARPLQVLVYLHAAAPDGSPLYLLLRRRPERFGIWQGVTGRVEEGEEPRDAAAREVREETGFGVEGARLEPLGEPRAFELEEAFERFYPGCHEIVEHAFHAAVPLRSPEIDPGEHVEARWCDLREALGLLYWPANRAAMRLLHRRLEFDGAEAGL